MRFSLETLLRNLGERIRRDLAEALPAALAQVRKASGDAQQDAATIDGREIGAALIEAMGVKEAGRVSALELSRVSLAVEGATVDLEPEDADRHPFLAWLPDTVAGAVDLPILDGATLATLAVGRPQNGTAWLFERGEQGPRATIQFEVDALWGPAIVTAYYGPVDIDGPFVTTAQLDLGALFKVGLALASRARPSPSVRKVAEPKLDAAVPVDVVRH